MKTKKLLPPRQAWRKIAERLEERDAMTGLCVEISELQYAGLIGIDTKMTMRQQLVDVFGASLYDFRWPMGETTPRIIAATLLAEGA